MSFLNVYKEQHGRVGQQEKKVLKFHINWLLAFRENQKFMPLFKLIMMCHPLLGYLAEIIPVVVGTFILFPLAFKFCSCTFLCLGHTEP